MISKEKAITVLKKVKDPEIDVDIWTLGLIYNIAIEETNKINIEMTLTTPFCPFGPQIIMEVKQGLEKAGFKEPEVKVVFDPPWKPSEEVRTMLGV